ncbi:MAG: DUF4406 domain-containing protein [Azoarcus sp.]|jgi:hypothetical protein|nr:DUF4406 domain-containing protein [Azoarcus sp.]
MKIYLCGPMSGLPDLNYPAFNAEADRLRALGHEVINPAELHPVTEEWKSALRQDIAVMLDRRNNVDVLAYLPGWEDSDGAIMEIGIARRLGIVIVAAGGIYEEAL